MISSWLSSRQPLALVGGALGAELCCLAIGATAGASIYLCAVSYYVDAALRQPHARTAAALGCVRSTAVFVAKVSGAPRGGVGGTLEGSGLSDPRSASRLSRCRAHRACFQTCLRAPRRRLRQNERRCRLLFVLSSDLLTVARSKTSPNTAHQRALLERCSHIQARPDDSITASAARATTSLGCGIRSATATSLGARIRPNRHRSAHATPRPGGPSHPPASRKARTRA